MILPSDFRRTHMTPSYLSLRQVPLALWAGDLPATGDGLRYAFGVPRHLWAIGCKEDPAGWDVEPILRQFAADIVRGEIVVCGLVVPLRALLDSRELMRATRKIEAAGHSAEPVDHAAYLLQEHRVLCYLRPPGYLSTLEARALLAKARANAGLTYDEAMDLTLSEVAAHRRGE